MLDLNCCRQRQQRLIEVLQQQKLDAAVCGLDRHVYYFTGYRPLSMHHAAAVIFADGRTWLTTPNEPATDAAADTVDAFVAQHMSTLRQERPTVAAEQAVEQLKARGPRRIGVDASIITSQVQLAFDGQCQAIDADCWQMRRRKDPDELELMRGAIRCTEAMHARARQIVEPGIDELEVFGQLHTAAVHAAGEPLTGMLGNDYACAELGGAPRRDRQAKAGELYILDVGPSYRGYWADNARTLAVDRRPTDAQLQAHQRCADALKLVESMARPGVTGRDLFDAVDDLLKQNGGNGLIHHLGHGVGLEAHEYPHLNPNWLDTLIEGEIISVEPGYYAPDLHHGVRLENQYLITPTGVENLLNAALDLA